MDQITKPTEVDWTTIDTVVKHAGKQIVLPADPGEMEFGDAIKTLKRIQKQEEQEFDVHEVVKGAPWDTLVAVYRAMQEIYGVVLSESRQTFFGELKPDFVTVFTGPAPSDRIQVPMGQMSLPGVKSPINVFAREDGTHIISSVRKKDRARLIEIVNLARRMIEEQSVYKGKAIRLLVDEDGDLEFSNQPEFLDLSAVKETDMVHTADTEAQIRTSIFSPLRNTDGCRKNKIPLKRGILLEGRYGTGKTLTARVAAKIATDNGWTFLMLNRSQGLKAALDFARQYQPCVIFAEDIDRCADRDDEEVNDLVNLLDGLDTKTSEIMVVLTTNYIEKIDQAILRPGRLDAVISIDAPDAETAQRIIRAYAGNLLEPDIDLSEAGELLSGQIPATIREAVERAKLAMLSEGHARLTAEDIRIAALGMRRHMALLEPKMEEKSPTQRFADSLAELVATSLVGGIDAASADDVRDARNAVIKRVSSVNRDVDRLTDLTKSIGGATVETLERSRHIHSDTQALRDRA
jgi:transitional endoplasmic reticulum ATPase